MKQSLLVITVLLLSVMSSVNAQEFSELQKSPTDISYAKADRKAKPAIKVIYSRPQKKGRKIFGELVKFGEVWRTGADEATEINFFQDVKMGGKSVKAGTYSLFTIPGEKEWTVILNSEIDQWGAYSYDKSKNVAEIKVPVSKGKALEAFSITFKKEDGGYQMFLGWDTVRVEVPFQI